MHPLLVMHIFTFLTIWFYIWFYIILPIWIPNETDYATGISQGTGRGILTCYGALDLHVCNKPLINLVPPSSRYGPVFILCLGYVLSYTGEWMKEQSLNGWTSTCLLHMSHDTELQKEHVTVTLRPHLLRSLFSLGMPAVAQAHLCDFSELSSLFIGNERGFKTLTVFFFAL